MNSFILLTAIFISGVTYSKTKYPYPENQRITLRPDHLAMCMFQGQRIDPQTIRPEKHYKNNFYPERSGNFNCAYSRDSFFSYLMAGPWRCDFQTGKEKGLRDWVLLQKDNSIDPTALFQKAMEINGSHIFNSLLTIHQLLRNEARWWDSKHYFYESSKKSEHDFWKKFIDIRGDLKERGADFKGDHAGSWYRMWGIALYRIAQLEEDECQETVVNSTWRDLKVGMVGTLAELSKFVEMMLGSEAETDKEGKSRINSMGGRLGSEILKVSQMKTPMAGAKEICDKKSYLIKETNFIPSELFY